MTSCDYALIWREEQEILFHLAALVPQGGTIVEIGTALGGTARIFYEATKEKCVDIFSVDINTFERAKKNLSDTTVNLITDSSVSFANKWHGKDIDLLFIDGDHSLMGIANDYAAWSKHVKKGGTIIFHDYDQPRRGGVAHFAVRVFAETLKESKALKSWTHEYKLLACKKQQDCHFEVKHFNNVISEICKAIIKSIKDVNCKSHEIIQMLKQNSNGVSTLDACIILEGALFDNFEMLDQVTRNRARFRKWAETLFMLRNAVETSIPYKDFQFSTLELLSSYLSIEQVRFNILSAILEDIVGWDL